MEELSSFGEWLKRRRKALDLTQEQLAQRISCSASALRKIEAEERRPSEQIVVQLAAVFNIPSHERATFLKFARGNLGAIQIGEIEDAPWRVTNRPEYKQDAKAHLVTFLFTDIEDSTKLWESAPEKMKVALQRHHVILQEAISSNGGEVFQIAGDAFCAVFPTAPTAISAAVTAQRELYRERWDLPFPIRVRMGIHTGDAEPNIPSGGGYASHPTMNRVARILKAAHGGQVLLSLSTKVLIGDSLSTDIELRDMGEHYLKNLINPENLFQMNIADLPFNFPSLKTLNVSRHNLPLQMTSFIGREKEIADVKRLLERSRLVTLTGPGGTGKTRLTIEVGNALLDQYPDGVWMVELAPILDPLLIPRTTAIAIGLRDESQRPVIDSLCDYLINKRVLLVLDNCEHLVEACAQLADTLLHACPHIRILTSSRESLGIAGETSYLVPSLTLPDIQNLPPIESLTQYEAIKLFNDRAASAIPTFTLTNENTSSIAQICQRLDGIPLAIELAAGKIRALSTQQIAQHLDDRFRLLTGGSRTALPRHQTLQAAVEWSYNLLYPAEQILFRRLSSFVGGWTLEAAESVCSDRDTDAKGALKSQDVLHLQTQLVNKSLVTAEEQNGEVRYHLLETIRQYAHEELLKSDDMNKVQIYHLDFFVKFSEDAEPKLLGKDQLIWLDRLENELDNIRAALAWSLESEYTVSGLRLAGALWRFWDVRNHRSEGRERLVTLLSHPTTVAQTKERAKALYAAGILAQTQNDHASAGPYFSEGLAISRELQDRPAIGYFLLGLARTWKRHRGNQDNPWLLDEGLEIFRELGDRRGLALALEGQGTAALVKDDLVTANSRRAESIKIYRELGDKISLCFALNGLANVLMFQGNYDQSVILYSESLTIFRELGHKWGIAWTLRVLGEVARCQGNYTQAKALYEESLGLSQESGDKAHIAAALHNLAYVSQHEGDYPQAVMLFTQSLSIFHEIEDKLAVAWCLVGLAGQVQAMGYSEHSAHLFGTAQPLFDATGKRFEPADQIEYQRNLSSMRAQLDEATFEIAFAEGQKMSLDEALDLALKTVEQL